MAVGAANRTTLEYPPVEVRIFGKYLVLRETAGQQPQCRRHWNPRVPNRRNAGNGTSLIDNMRI